MGKKYLMDTNTVIDYLGDKLPPKSADFLDNIVQTISIMTRIEVLGWYDALPEQIAFLSNYMQEITILPLDEAIALKTIEIRQNHRIKTPDAVIAATALVQNFTLISRNLSDFRRIRGLEVIDPYAI